MEANISEITKQVNLPGIIEMYGGSSAPKGYLLCDGSNVSRTTYAALFAAIGTNFGEGDGSTTFTLPDFRGMFPRGVDKGAGNDPDAASRTAQATGGNDGDNVGSKQTSIWGAHSHRIDDGNSDTVTSASGVMTSRAYVGSSTGGGTTSDYWKTQIAGGDETRPKNLGVNFIIKT